MRAINNHAIIEIIKKSIIKNLLNFSKSRQSLSDHRGIKEKKFSKRIFSTTVWLKRAYVVQSWVIDRKRRIKIFSNEL